MFLYTLIIPISEETVKLKRKELDKIWKNAKRHSTIWDAR